MERHGHLRNPSVLVGVVAALLACLLVALLVSAHAHTSSGGSARPVEQVSAPSAQKAEGAGASTSSEPASPEENPAEESEPVAVTLDPRTLVAGNLVSDQDIERAGGLDSFFYAEPISDEVFARMEGKSFSADCTVARDELRYVRVLHVDAEGQRKVGELVVHRNVAADIVDIFRQLYDANYPIHKMHLVDDYDASDDLSCGDDNTAAFNYRVIAGTTMLSNHAYGLAIDISPFENPYCIPYEGFVAPAAATKYADRTLDEPYMIHRGDFCYQLFIEHGWEWGGDWDSPKDYQHFEKPDARWQ